MKYSLIVFAFLLGLVGSSPASAAGGKIGEGYAPATFKELSQTLLMMGGLDIKDPKVVDEYAKLAYCTLYQKNFRDDFEWNKNRSAITARVLEKKEYYRISYETAGVFNLDRYDSASQSFPFTAGTAMVNVGSIALLASSVYRPFCGMEGTSAFFAPDVVLLPNKPLTVSGLRFPEAEAQKILAKMAETGNTDRQLYGRIRFRVTDAKMIFDRRGRAQRSELRGDITAVDFFLDADMTQYLSSAPLPR